MMNVMFSEDKFQLKRKPVLIEEHTHVTVLLQVTVINTVELRIALNMVIPFMDV